MSSRSTRLLADSGLAMTAAWNRASAVWKDETARRFASEFWAPGQEALRRYQSAVERLELALQKAERVSGAE